MGWHEEDEGDIAFADDLKVAPRGRVIRRGGQYEVEDVCVIPSLPALLRTLDADGHDLRDPSIALLAPAQDVIAFCLHHGIGIDQVLALLRGQESYEVVIRKGFLQSVWLNLRLFQEGDATLSETGVPLPVAELHSPRIEGCESSYEVTTAETVSAGLKLSVRGVGAGAGLSMKLKFHDKLWTEGTCGQITVPADIELVPWVNPDSGERINMFSITNISAGQWELAEIPDGRLHLCTDAFEERFQVLKDAERRRWVRSNVDYFRHPVAVKGGLERTRNLEASREFSLTLSDRLELKSQFTSEYAYAYKVVGVADYVGFFEDRRSEVFFWTWRTGLGVKPGATYFPGPVP